MIAIVGALTRKTFEVEAVIAAPPEAVWSVLMDTAAYPEWNPVFVEVNGAYVEGERVQNTVRDPSGKLLEMTATVTALTPERELRQKGGVPLVITFDHRWNLTPVEGGTLVKQLEVDRGFYLWFWDSDRIEPAYSNVLGALAGRTQALAGAD